MCTQIVPLHKTKQPVVNGDGEEAEVQFVLWEHEKNVKKNLNIQMGLNIP